MNWEDRIQFDGFLRSFFLNLNPKFIHESSMSYESFTGCILLDKSIKDLE